MNGGASSSTLGNGWSPSGTDSPGRSTARSRQARPDELQEPSWGTAKGGKLDPAALQNKLWLCIKSIFSIAGSNAAATTIITSGSAATTSVRVTQAQLFLASSKVGLTRYALHDSHATQKDYDLPQYLILYCLFSRSANRFVKPDC